MLFLHVENEDNRGPGTTQLAAACDWTMWGAKCQVSIKGFINRSYYHGPQATAAFYACITQSQRWWKKMTWESLRTKQFLGPVLSSTIKILHSPV